jgi:hypothetical protein
MSIFRYFIFCLSEQCWPESGGYEGVPVGGIEDEI